MLKKTKLYAQHLSWVQVILAILVALIGSKERSLGSKPWYLLWNKQIFGWRITLSSNTDGWNNVDYPWIVR